MPKKRIIVVEDERDMADLVAMRLRREGYQVEIAHDGQAGLERIRSDPPDLALIDIMIPRLSGTDLATELRQDPRTATLPIIFLTAKTEESEIIVGLRLGADDYVTKPFSMSVLVARVEAVLRRAHELREAAKRRVEAGPIAIDQGRHEVRVHGEAVSLTLTEFRLLTALVAARGRVLTREQLIGQSMGMNAVVTDRTVDVHLAALRRKLGEARACIETVRGIGYRFSPEATDEADQAT